MGSCVGLGDGCSEQSTAGGMGMEKGRLDVLWILSETRGDGMIFEAGDVVLYELKFI